MEVLLRSNIRFDGSARRAREWRIQVYIVYAGLASVESATLFNYRRD